MGSESGGWADRELGVSCAGATGPIVTAVLVVFPGETMSGSSFAPASAVRGSSMNPIAIRAIRAIRAIEAMVAPVVLITTAAILSGGILSMYGSVNDRTMNRERLESLTSDTGTFLSVSVLPASSRERLAQIDIQLPMLLNRHRLLKNAVLAIFAAIGVLVLSVIVIGAAVTSGSGGVGVAALALVLAGTTTLLVGLLMATRSILMSQDAIDSEIRRALSLGS